MPYLLIANIFSFFSACFTVASAWTKDPHRTYWYQVGQCLIYAVAAYFFGVYSTILMMIFNAFRNYLVAAEKYTTRRMAMCSLFSLVFGLMINGSSIPGYLSVFMTVYYTVSSFYLKGALAVKINVTIDLAMWFIYDLMVVDVPSGIVDFVSVVLALITFRRILRENTHRDGPRDRGQSSGQKDRP